MKFNNLIKKDYLLERICYYSFFCANKPIYVCVFSLELKSNEISKLKVFLKEKNIKLISLKGSVVRNFSHFSLGYKNLVGGKLCLVFFPQINNIELKTGILPVFFLLNGIVCLISDVINNDLVKISLGLIFDFLFFMFLCIDLINIVLDLLEYFIWQL